MKQIAIAFAGGAAVLLLIACGRILGLNEDDPPPPTDNGTSGTSPYDGGTTSTGFIDLDANVARCTTARAIQSTDLFVTSSNGAGEACSKDQPCELAKAIEKAGAAKTTTIINLGPGTYAGDVVLPQHTHLAGGWKADWTFECDQKLVVLQGTEDNRTIRVTDGPDTKVILLTIQTPTRPAHASESFYGVFAIGPTTDLTLENVAIGAGPGAPGADGVRGTQGGTTDPPGCADNNGLDGPKGADGTKGELALCDVNGCRLRAGGRGVQGEDGRGGTQGGPGNDSSDGLMCAGGAAPNCDVQACGRMTSEKGHAGCGGSAGGGGNGGESGGGSFGLFAWDGAKVNVVGGLVGSANGGNGGRGGLGGDGGLGTNGIPGANLVTGCEPLAGNPCTFQCQPVANAQTTAGGTAGGKGGNGGLGGQGGAGAGGLSFSVVTGGGASVVLKDVRTAFGPPGQGAPPDGMPGKAAERGP